MRFTHHRANHKLIWYTGDAPDVRDNNLLGHFAVSTHRRIGSGNFDSNVEDYW